MGKKIVKVSKTHVKWNNLGNPFGNLRNNLYLCARYK